MRGRRPPRGPRGELTLLSAGPAARSKGGIGSIDVETLGIEVSADPGDDVVVLGVLVVVEDPDDALVATRSAAVLGWARAGPAEAERVGQPMVERQLLLHLDMWRQPSPKSYS